MTQKTRAELAADVTNNLADNTAGDITAEDVRTVLTDYSDSFLSIDDDEEVAATMLEGIADKAAHALAMGVPYFAAAPLVPSVPIIDDQGQVESFTPVESIVFPADCVLITNSEDPAEIDAISKGAFRTFINVEDGADVTDATNVDAAGAVMESDYNAQTILAATTDNTPAALTIAEQRIVGRITGGNVAALTGAEVAPVVLGTAAAANLTWGWDGSSAPIARTAAQQNALLFAALTGGVYSTAGTMSAFAPWGKNSLWLPAGAFTPRTTNGCAALTTTETATNKLILPVLDFDTSADEHAQANIWLPKSYNASTVLMRPVWTFASSSGTVAWALRARVYADDDAADQAMGTEQLSTDTALTAGDIHIGPATSAITLGGTPAKERFLAIEVFRDVSGDTLGADARLIGIILDITTDAATDD